MLWREGGRGEEGEEEGGGQKAVLLCPCPWQPASCGRAPAAYHLRTHSVCSRETLSAATAAPEAVGIGLPFLSATFAAAVGDLSSGGLFRLLAADLASSVTLGPRARVAMPGPTKVTSHSQPYESSRAGRLVNTKAGQIDAAQTNKHETGLTAQ
jgi:hypothetical protein